MLCLRTWHQNCGRVVAISGGGQCPLVAKKPFGSRQLLLAAMEILRAKRAAQKSALKDLKRCVQKAEVRAKTRAQGPPKLVARTRCPSTLVTTEMVYHLAGGDRQAAEEFFALSRRNKTPLTAILAPTLLLEWAARSPEAVAALLACGVESDWKRRRAEKFLAERGLRDWVMQQNLLKACAPGARSVLDEAARRGLAGEPDGPARRRAVLFQWVRRWSSRFHLLRGRFQPGARLRPAACLQKAQQSTAGWQKQPPRGRFLWPHFRGRPAGRKSGPLYMSAIISGAARRPRNRGHISHTRACQGYDIMEVGKSFASRVPARSPGHPSQHGRDVPALGFGSGKRVPGAPNLDDSRGIPEPTPGRTARTTSNGDDIHRRGFRRGRCASIAATGRRCERKKALANANSRNCEHNIMAPERILCDASRHGPMGHCWRIG